MQLFGSLGSPYVRKVRVAAAELGIADRIAFTVLDAHTAPPELVRLNPLSKVPSLITDDGDVIFDSPVVVEWLDAHFGPLLIPAGRDRWRVMTGAALADGILDAGVMARTERQRPPELQSKAHIDKQMAKVVRGLDQLEAETGWRGDAPDLARIGIACAIGWLEFRMPGLAPEGRPGLMAWYQTFAARPSMRATVPG